MITASIFIGTYAVVAAGGAPYIRLDRTRAAILGAVLMILTGAGFAEAARAVDVPTIVLLFSMMVIVGTCAWPAVLPHSGAS